MEGDQLHDEVWVSATATGILSLVRWDGRLRELSMVPFPGFQEFRGLWSGCCGTQRDEPVGLALCRENALSPFPRAWIANSSD